MVSFLFVFSCFFLGSLFAILEKGDWLHLSLFYGNRKYCQKRVLFARCCEKLMYQITFIVSLLIKTHICDITRISDLLFWQREEYFSYCSIMFVYLLYYCISTLTHISYCRENICLNIFFSCHFFGVTYILGMCALFWSF